MSDYDDDYGDDGMDYDDGGDYDQMEYEEEVKQDCTKVCVAFWLLRQYNYDSEAASNPSSKLIDIIYSSGIKDPQYAVNECILCCEEADLHSLDCKHKFCRTCWKSYLEAGIKGGMECGLVKKCPLDGCKQYVDLEFFKIFLSENSHRIFEGFLTQDYIILSKKAVLCPGKNCAQVIILNQFKGSLKAFDEAHFNITCTCGQSFCSLCRDEAHRPLSCIKFKEWSNLIGGKSSEQIDELWIKLNTKKCPKCKVDIEKNQGCMHMTCRKCTYEFCWLCMGDWKNHKDCNIYQEKHQTEQNQIKKESEEELKRYTFFSDRYIQHRKAISFAQKKKIKIEGICGELNKKLKEIINFEFLTEAIITVIECRRAVTFSYAMGYMIEPKKRALLEFLQKELEGNLEKLDHKTDQKFDLLYEEAFKSMNTDFYNFQRDVKSLTLTLNKYFGNMIDSFERDLPELSKQDSTKQASKQSPSATNTNDEKKKGRVTKKGNNKNEGQAEEDSYESIPSWKCDFCGNSNSAEYVICEGCLMEKK